MFFRKLPIFPDFYRILDKNVEKCSKNTRGKFTLPSKLGTGTDTTDNDEVSLYDNRTLRKDEESVNENVGVNQ